jgi:phage-related protein
MMLKVLAFRGTALRDLQGFPPTARREAGWQLYQVQRGRMPDDYKFMRSVGPGVLEIRISDEAGAFRLIYVAKHEEKVFVLHCFQKKSMRTSRADIELARTR